MNRPLTTANHQKSLVFIGGAIALTAAAIYIVQSSETNPQEAAETADIGSPGKQVGDNPEAEGTGVR
ncbi:hypothetical protein ABKN59_011725 [Abortiporus biennis]